MTVDKIMNEVAILNFDMGRNPSIKEIKIGPFTISLMEDYEERRLSLKYRTDVETAVISYKEKENSLLLKSNLRKPQNALCDVFYILSYLTGRVVTTKNRSYLFITKYEGGNRIVDKQDLVEAINVAWENRCNFKDDNEKRPLWLYFEYIQNPNIENKLIFATIAFEVVQEIALKEIKLDDGLDSDAVKFFCLKRKIMKLIKNSDISDQLKNPLLTNIGNWTGKKSIEGIKRYLFERRFLNEMEVTDDVRDRIQFINRLRNSILHRAEVSKPKNNIDMEQIFNFSSEIIPGFIQDYLNSKFNIQNYHRIRQTHEDIKGFLYTGKYHGVKWLIPI